MEEIMIKLASIVAIFASLKTILGGKAYRKLITGILQSKSFRKAITILSFIILVLGLIIAFSVGIMSLNSFHNIYLALMTFLVLAIGYVFTAYYAYQLVNASAFPDKATT